MRNYKQELADMSRAIEADLMQAIKDMMPCLKHEQLSQTEDWYKFPGDPISLDLSWSDEPMMCDAFVPEGTKFRNGYVVPEGGMLYGDHPRNEEQEVQNLDMHEMLSLLEELRHLIKTQKVA